MRRGRFVVLGLAAFLAGCKEENRYVPPPPPEVGVSQPVQRTVTDFLELTGQTAAVNSIDLVARVEGFLQSVEVPDGSMVKKGQLLFRIEPDVYQAKLDQANAQVQQQQAELDRATAEYERQQRLIKQNATSEADVEQWKAQQETATAGIAEAKSNVELAQINLAYTKVAAPFDGRMGAHLVDVGSLVGAGAPTKLAPLVQVDPIWVNFNVSEGDVLRIKESLHQRGITYTEAPPIAVEVGLQTEAGYPHQGKLDYVAPELDTSTGTLTARAVLDNADRAFLPGLFVRVRVPVGKHDGALLVPQRALGSDQGGAYLLVIDAESTVEQRHVTLGPAADGMRIVAGGIKPDDRIVTVGLQRAVPGSKVSAKDVPPEAATPPPAKP